MESEYDSSGGRQAKRSTIALPANPRHGQLDRVVRQMQLRVPQHGETIKLFYVGTRNRKGRTFSCSPFKICRIMVLRFEDFPKWMFDCRAMVLNLLRML